MTTEPRNYSAPDDVLRDRVILVTGAGDGIGKGVATALGAHGATVILLGRTIAKLEKTYDAIKQAGGPEPAIYPMNLEGAAEKDYVDLAQKLDEVYGRLDGLLHNAGILGSRTPLEQYDVMEWQRVMLINVTAPFVMTRACMPLLRKAKDASIVLTSSGVGRKGRAYWGAYAVSKFATEGFMEVLADELENTSSIRVNSINPGAVRTGMRLKAYPAEDRSKLKTSEEITAAYLYLLGPDSQGVTGQKVDAQ